VGVGAAYSAIKSAGQAERVAVGSGKAKAQEGGPDGAVRAGSGLEGQQSSGSSSGASVSVKKDSVGFVEDPRGAETKFKVTTNAVKDFYKNGRLVRWTEPKVSVTIRTIYAKGANPEAQSAYGRGTTDADKAAGNTSLRFHEDQHKAAIQQFVSDNPAPMPDFEVGMTPAEFQANGAAWHGELRAWQAAIDTYSDMTVDCVGTKASFCP